MDEIKGLRIALGHEARVGKDTFADRMNAQLIGVISIAFGEKLKKIATHIQSELDQPIEKDPILLQLEGALLREHYGKDVFVRSVENRIKAANPDANIVVTDARYQNEMNALNYLRFTTVKITRNDRVIDRNPNHESERALANSHFDHVIENNGSIEEFHEKIDQLLLELYQNNIL